jgi:hypothetical protein
MCLGQDIPQERRASRKAIPRGNGEISRARPDCSERFARIGAMMPRLMKNMRRN